jgi:hypothetical protein
MPIFDRMAILLPVPTGVERIDKQYQSKLKAFFGMQVQGVGLKNAPFEKFMARTLKKPFHVW